jgi:hypothetical protein
MEEFKMYDKNIDMKDITEELQNYDRIFEDMSGAINSVAMGNQGKYCTLSIECQWICVLIW